MMRRSVVESCKMVTAWLVKNVGLKGPHKLADRWKPDPYIVLGRKDESLPVYNVQPEEGGRISTLHRNLLLPIGRSDTPEDVPSSGPSVGPSSKAS